MATVERSESQSESKPAGRLSGRRILLTGVSRGVGRATARLFLEEGAEVLGLARDPARLAAARAELSGFGAGRFDALALDLGAPDAPARARELVASRWGALDVLWNNAGIMLSEAPTFAAEPPGTLEATLAVNLLAPFHLSLALLPLLRQGREPRIVHVSSGAGTFGALAEPNILSYRVSKWALNGLTQIQAAELAGQIAVNAFDPGWVKTDLGGPRAPGTVEESARGGLALLLEPFSTTGRLFKDGQAIPY
jgi:NAD(P)-dependent dehydrogenase (short-subunit alcohol dehydrogenase family)